MQMFQSLPRCRSRAGLTLIELVVVVAILITLAALIVPMLPNVTDKANKASIVTNLKEADKLIQTDWSVNDFKYAEGWDSLVHADGTLCTYLPGGPDSTSYNDDGAVGGALTAGTLDESMVESLLDAGISTLCPMRDFGDFRGASNPSYMSGLTAEAIAEGTPVAFVTKTEAVIDDDTGDVISEASIRLGNKWTLDASHDYILLGIGKNSSLVGPGCLMKDPPILLHGEGCDKPGDAYSCVCAVFDLGEPVTSRGQTTRPPAKFLGCVGLSDRYCKFSEELTNIGWSSD